MSTHTANRTDNTLGGGAGRQPHLGSVCLHVDDLFASKQDKCARNP